VKFRSARISRKKARIELVPMIDTMVFLLVFFMMASLAMTRQKGLPVALPSAESAPKATWADRAVVLTETADGRIYIDKNEIDKAELRALLSSRLTEKPETVVVINADETLAHREVVRLMDQARQAGATHMAIATNGEDSGEIED